MMPQAPVTIAGGGLAGCTLAWALRTRGCPVRVVDRGGADTATRVAAGIVNPITGPKLGLSWRFAELWPVARAFYEEVGAGCPAPLFRDWPLLRLFDSEEQAARWARRLGEPAYRGLAASMPELPEGYCGEFGGFLTEAAGALDTAAFVAATRAELGGDWEEGELAAPAGGGGDGVL